MKRVLELLEDPGFVRIDGSQPGTILIISPYRESFQKYRTEVAKTVVPERAGRVEVRTVGTVQGGEADVVFLDMVKQKASTFSDDKKRLCVAITRARQAEVIMMSEGMTKTINFSTEHSFTPYNLKAIYEGCRSGIHGALIRNPPDSAPGKVTKAKDQDLAVSSLAKQLESSHISSGQDS